jgi:uncharacterized integral membrane protein
MPDDAELHDLHEGGRPTARLIAFVVLLIVLIWFGVANRTDVRVSFIVVHSKVRLIYALAVAAILGALVDRLATLVRRRR